MPRPSLIVEKRSQLIPVVARAFADLGYRRATIAEIAGRCGVQENILYRLWSDKKAMFIASIDHVYEVAERSWTKVLAAKSDGSSAERLLEYEARHLGEFGYVRIVFAGLMEADDPEIRLALATMYRRYQSFVAEQVRLHRRARRSGTSEDHESSDLAAWALVGLGTIGSIARELRLLGDADRRRLVAEAGRRLLD